MKLSAFLGNRKTVVGSFTTLRVALKDHLLGMLVQLWSFQRNLKSLEGCLLINWREDKHPSAWNFIKFKLWLRRFITNVKSRKIYWGDRSFKHRSTISYPETAFVTLLLFRINNYSPNQANALNLRKIATSRIKTVQNITGNATSWSHPFMGS